MTILLFGANGQVGQELLRALAPLGKVVATTRSGVLPDGSACETADFGQPDSLQALLDRLQPSIGVNAAAYTAVDRAEQEVDAAFAANAQAPGVIVPAVAFGKRQEKSIDELRALHRAGQLAAFAEVSIQYRGLRADDPRFAPYFALAEELDIPVGIHLGEGPPGAARFPGYEDYRASLTTPFQLEEVLRRHPKLRIWVMHYASPLVDEMIAMMFTHPNLYVDVSCNNWGFPRAQFHDALKRMVDAGFEKRILFGSDQMYWPDAIGEAIKAIDTAPFLSPAQKRDIFYNNAARFLRLQPGDTATRQSAQR